MTRPDLLVQDHGTLILFKPTTRSGRAWVREHVPLIPQYMVCGSGWIAADHGPAGAIVNGALGDGLIVAYLIDHPN